MIGVELHCWNMKSFFGFFFFSPFWGHVSFYFFYFSPRSPKHDTPNSQQGQMAQTFMASATVHTAAALSSQTAELFKIFCFLVEYV